jgi:hypothetical protein
MHNPDKKKPGLAGSKAHFATEGEYRSRKRNRDGGWRSKLWDHEARVQVGGGMRNDMADERKGWKEPTMRSYARRRDLHNHFHVTLDLDR